MKVYLDACCINRPFDDQTQDRVRLEAEAVLIVIRHFENHEWTWYGSDILDFELNQIPDIERRQKTRQLIRFLHSIIEINGDIVGRAIDLEKLGFKAYDALHLACAEEANVDVLLTTDERFLRLGYRFKDQIKVKLSNPLSWINERTIQ